MSVGRGFALDANAFIEAYRSYYGFDICPGFWLALLRQHSAKRVVSIDKIKTELLALNDALNDWVLAKTPSTFFKGTGDKRVADAYKHLVNWVLNEQQFTQEAKAEFSSVADGWLVAYAKVNGLVVVTHEEYAPDVRKKIPIPNVCIEFNVEYCNTFDMLRDLKEQFVLRKRRRRS